jgi:multiple sugar transport system ATP-binding protein
MAAVRLVDVCRKFAQTIAIDHLSLTIPDGEFWVLVGGSGCGKSTILRSIAGLETITSGQIYIGDRLVNEVPARDRDVAMVFQNYALYPHFTVAENLAFGLKMRKIPTAEITTRVQRTAQMLNISSLLDRLPSQLSGGQQQRVALGRAIGREPQVFLLDEPLSNLDAQLRNETRAELKQLHQQVGITTIYVTHDQLEAMTLADKIVVLGGGRIQQIGTPAEIYHQPVNRLVATFMGNPPMNILPATYQKGGWQIGQQFMPWVSHSNYQPTPGQGCDLGIRPEQLSLKAQLGWPALKTIVKLVEPLGKEILVKAQIADLPIVINFLAPADWQGNSGEQVTIYFNLAQLYLFDPSTGDRYL